MEESNESKTKTMKELYENTSDNNASDGPQMNTTKKSCFSIWVFLNKLSVFFFSVFLFLSILVTNGVAITTFYRMLGQLNPTTNFSSLNYLSGGDVFYNNSVSIKGNTEIHISWFWAIMIVLLAPHVYTILSCIWIKCHSPRKICCDCIPTNDEEIEINNDTADENKTVTNSTTNNRCPNDMNKPSSSGGSNYTAMSGITNGSTMKEDGSESGNKNNDSSSNDKNNNSNDDNNRINENSNQNKDKRKTNFKRLVLGVLYSCRSMIWTLVTYWLLPLVDGVTAMVVVGLFSTIYSQPWMLKLCCKQSRKPTSILFVLGVLLIIIVLCIEFSNHSRNSDLEIRSITISIVSAIFAFISEIIRFYLIKRPRSQPTEKNQDQPNHRPPDHVSSDRTKLPPIKKKQHTKQVDGGPPFYNPVTPSSEAENNSKLTGGPGNNTKSGNSQDKKILLRIFRCCCFVQNICILRKKETFYIVLSCVQSVIIVLFSLVAISGPCGDIISYFSMGSSLKCRFMEYDVSFIAGGNGEAYFSSFLCILSSFVCLKMCYYACVTNVQATCCYLPLLVSTLLTPVFMALSSRYRWSVLGYLIMPNDFTHGFEINLRSGALISAAVVWMIVVVRVCVNRIFKGNPAEQMEHQERLFMYPYFHTAGLAMSIFWSRISKLDDLIEDDIGRGNESSKTDNKHRHVYVCSTMMREKSKEMETLVASILRLFDQTDHTATNTIKHTYEAHIIFDDAFLDDQPNEYVKRLETITEREMRRKYSDKMNCRKIEYPTPYGRKYVYGDKDKAILTVHLKDKKKIRVKKRWSQVMYMYYFLKYNPLEDPRQGALENQFILTLDGDVKFKPKAVKRLVELMDNDKHVGAACGRIIPEGKGPMIWYQKFEYAASHWLQKSTEHVFGCCLCSPGCFSLFRCSALDEVLQTYTQKPEKALHHIQYDLGEDRWLCTLLLKKGFKVEYMSAAAAKTFAPETFVEFCKQRRRWTPSTLANILDVIWKNNTEICKINPHINKMYLIYQTYLFVSSIVTPGTIFLVILGALIKAFPDLPLWVALLLNIAPVAVLMIICVTTDKDELPIYVCGVLSTVYSLLMIVLLIGLAIEAKQSEFCSISTFFFGFVLGIFILAALLHPREFKYLFYGTMYFFAVPAVSMILLIYILGSLHILRWGTRERRPDFIGDDSSPSILRRCCGTKKEERGADDFVLLCDEPNQSVGGKVVMRCNRHVASESHVVWKREGREINKMDGRFQMDSYGFPKLVINNAKPSDSGIYTCEVTQLSGGQIEFGSPTVTIDGQQIVKLKVANGCDTIAEGDNVEILCEIECLEKNDTIVWKKDNSEIGKPTKYDEKRDHLRHVIEEANKREHAGTYSCEVLYHARKDEIEMEKTTISIDEAQGYTFKCGISKPMITWIDWKINGKSIKKVDKKEIKCHVINNRELVIKKKSISKVSRISYTAATERFDVTETFEIDSKEVVIVNKDYKCTIKSKRRLFPDSEVMWKKMDGTTENDFFGNPNVEMIRDDKNIPSVLVIQHPDDGKSAFRCIIKHFTKWDSITLDIVKPSIRLESPEIIDPNAKKVKIKLICKTSINLESLDWKKDDMKITHNYKYKIKKNNTLVIKDAEKGDAGTYTCRVKTKQKTVLEASTSIGYRLEENEEKFWEWLIEDHLSPEVDTFNKRKEVDGIMRSLRNTVYFLFFIVNALFVTSIFMMTQVNEFKGNIQISIPCPNKDGTFEVEPISMIFIFTFGLTLLFQFAGMIIHRFYTFLHVGYDTKVFNCDGVERLFVCYDKDDMV